MTTSSKKCPACLSLRQHCRLASGFGASCIPGRDCDPWKKYSFVSNKRKFWHIHQTPFTFLECAQPGAKNAKNPAVCGAFFLRPPGLPSTSLTMPAHAQDKLLAQSGAKNAKSPAVCGAFFRAPTWAR